MHDAHTDTDLPGPSLPFAAHDHGECSAAGFAAAEAHCRGAGLRLTPPRRQALKLLVSQHRAFGAYEVLDALAAEGLGSQPPAAYRALEFLTRHGLAHRIERLNAYVACPHPDQPHSPAFLICRVCRRVAEAPLAAVRAGVAEAAAATGFRVEGLVIEAVGECPQCAGCPGSAPPESASPGSAPPGSAPPGSASSQSAPCETAHPDSAPTGTASPETAPDTSPPAAARRETASPDDAPTTEPRG